MAEGGDNPGQQINIHHHYHIIKDGDRTTIGTNIGQQSNIRAGVIEQVGLSTPTGEAQPNVPDGGNEQQNLAADSPGGDPRSHIYTPQSQQDVGSALGRITLTDSGVNNYFAEEEAEAFVSESKFDRAISLLEHLPPTHRQQMQLMECYFQCNRNSEVLKCIEIMTTLVKRHSRPRAVHVYNLAMASFEKSSYIKAMALYACAAKNYLLEPSHDESLRGIKDCTIGCAGVIQKMIKHNEPMRIFARDVGMELMKGFVDDVSSIGDANPDVQADMLARCLNNVGFCYYIVGNQHRSLECYKRGIDVVTRQFGSNVSKYLVYGILLSNVGCVKYDLGDYPEDEALQERAIAVHKQAKDWPNDEKRKEWIERSENDLRGVRDKMKM